MMPTKVLVFRHCGTISYLVRHLELVLLDCDAVLIELLTGLSRRYEFSSSFFILVAIINTNTALVHPWPYSSSKSLLIKSSFVHSTLCSPCTFYGVAKRLSAHEARILRQVC